MQLHSPARLTLKFSDPHPLGVPKPFLSLVEAGLLGRHELWAAMNLSNFADSGCRHATQKLMRLGT